MFSIGCSVKSAKCVLLSEQCAHCIVLSVLYLVSSVQFAVFMLSVKCAMFMLSVK